VLLFSASCYYVTYAQGVTSLRISIAIISTRENLHIHSSGIARVIFEKHCCRINRAHSFAIKCSGKDLKKNKYFSISIYVCIYTFSPSPPPPFYNDMLCKNENRNEENFNAEPALWKIKLSQQNYHSETIYIMIPERKEQVCRSFTCLIVKRNLQLNINVSQLFQWNI